MVLRIGRFPIFSSYYKDNIGCIGLNPQIAFKGEDQANLILWFQLTQHRILIHIRLGADLATSLQQELGAKSHDTCETVLGGFYHGRVVFTTSDVLKWPGRALADSHLDTANLQHPLVPLRFLQPPFQVVT